MKNTPSDVGMLAQNLPTIPEAASEGWYEKLYNMLLGNIPFSLLLVDRSLRVVSANRNFLVKGRRNASDTVGAPIRDVFPSAILEYTQLEHKIRGVFDSGLPLPGAQMTYRAPGIHTRIYYYSVVPVRLGKLVEHVMLVMDDITEKVQLIEKARMVERHLATVVESANDLVVSTDAKGVIVSWSRAVERISGYQSNEARGRLLVELCESSQREDMKAMIRRLVEGSAVQLREIGLVARSGRVVPVDWSCSPILDDTDKVSGVVAVGRDLTERRAFEQHIFQSEKLAALGVMAGGIAHELRNPLAVSFSAAQFLSGLLGSTDDLAFQQECVNKIIDGIQRSSAIIENLLRFARPAPSDRVGTLDLVALAQETISVLAPQAKLQKIKVLERYADNSVSVSGNSNLLQQVLMNLILNACQAMPTGGEIVVDVKREAGEALIRVSDTGCGVSPANLRRVFDPFFTTQPVGKGTGLGLSISHTIVKQHGGEIELHSIEGQGSTFIVCLPLLKD
ncbi:MAG: ATP-binding protein [Gallionella sp.]